MVQNIKISKSLVLTDREIEVINKKLRNKKLTQQDSNYLSRFVRPKLREISTIDAKCLLNKIEYNQKIMSIENKIKKTILGGIKEVDSIILYGSVIQNNYKEYKDIDILIITIKEIAPIKEKIKKITEIKKILKERSINADVEIYDKNIIEKAHNRNPSLIYQLKDHKVIYGKLKIKNKAEIYRIDLRMKLDWSYIEDNPKGVEIYKALRNTILVRLLLNKIVDNQKLKESLYDELGKNLIERLKNNQESKLDRKIALIYLKNLLEKTEKEVEGELWEKIEL